MKALETSFKKKAMANQWFLILIVVFILSVVAGSVNPRYFLPANISNLLGQISVLSLVACGQTILIISGNIDISVGANIGLSSVIMAMLMRSGVMPWLAALIGILVAIISAFLIGGASILFKAPSFIVSMAAVGVFRDSFVPYTGNNPDGYGQFETLEARSTLAFFHSFCDCTFGLSSHALHSHSYNAWAKRLCYWK